ncbi:MAG: hypothetical protein HY043_22780 [Verrucomicrobia bacterium]|nr:hypothetical protein [Verrucomicrobiota bacterium]
MPATTPPEELAAVRESFTNLKPKADRLAELEAGSSPSAAQTVEMSHLRIDLERPLAAAAELAQRVFAPIIEAKLAEARIAVKDFANGDPKIVESMAGDHWQVSRLRKFLRYVDCHGNSTSRRAAMFLEHFGELLAEAEAPANAA